MQRSRLSENHTPPPSPSPPHAPDHSGNRGWPDSRLGVLSARKASGKNWPMAMAGLAVLAIVGFFVVFMVNAGQENRNSLEKQLSGATYQEALRLLNGTGVAKDEKRASEYILKAVTMGDTMSCHYAKGIGLVQGLAKANEYYQLAVNLENPKTMLELGINCLKGQGLEKDAARAVSLLQKSSGLGNATAQWNLGRLYANGSVGLPKHPTKAAELYTKASEQGHSEATLVLSECYDEGIGVPKDQDKAMDLLGKSIDSTHRKLQEITK